MTLYTLYGNFIRHIGKSPYSLLGITALLLILAALLTRPDRVTDVHFHDSYFVVEDRVVYLCCAVIAAITWLLYALTRQIRYVGALVWAHVILTWGIAGRRGCILECGRDGLYNPAAATL